MATVIVYGNLVKDAEKKSNSYGDFYYYSIAEHQGKDKTVFYDVFDRVSSPNLIKYLQKGKMVMINGRLETSIYKEKVRHTINCHYVELISSGQRNNEEAVNNNQTSKVETTTPIKKYENKTEDYELNGRMAAGNNVLMGSNPYQTSTPIDNDYNDVPF